jgi:hypothetical protein
VEKLRRTVLTLRLMQQEMHMELWFVNPTKFRCRLEKNIEVRVCVIYVQYGTMNISVPCSSKIMKNTKKTYVD